MSGSVLLHVAPTPGLLFLQEPLFVVHYLAKCASLRRFAAGLLNGDSEAADDCVQTAFLKVLTVMRAGRQIDNLGGFVRQALRNECLNERRRRKTRPTLSGDPDLLEQLPARGDGTVVAGNDEADPVVRGALAQLPGVEIEALTLKAEGLSYVQIAVRQGASPGKVAVRIRHARVHLRRVLGPLVAREGACFGRAG